LDGVGIFKGGKGEGGFLRRDVGLVGLVFGHGAAVGTPYLGAGPIPIVCHENGAMALNTTWTVRLTVKVTAPAGTVITESAATMADTPDPNLANNTATVSLTVVP
jgi:hypothetical protein